MLASGDFKAGRTKVLPNDDDLIDSDEESEESDANDNKSNDSNEFFY
jgi:hypothetical protein